MIQENKDRNVRLLLGVRKDRVMPEAMIQENKDRNPFRCSGKKGENGDASDNSFSWNHFCPNCTIASCRRVPSPRPSAVRTIQRSPTVRRLPLAVPPLDDRTQLDHLH